MTKKVFSITVSMISYNDERIIGDCLASIRNQDYDQRKVKILLIDGGSTDDTIKIANKYGVDIVSRPDLKNQPYIRGGMAFNTPNTDLILFFSADNRLQERDVLSKMTSTFYDDEVVGCETQYYGHSSSDPLISRYFSLIGGADPVAVGLGRADRAPHDMSNSHLSGKVEDCGYYYKVRFPKDVSKIPTLGANGFMFRKTLIKHTTLAVHAAHTDLCVDWIMHGYDSFSFVKDRHVKHLIEVGVFEFIKRRLYYEEMYSPENIKRIYSVYQKKDFFRLVYIVFTYSTLVIPFIRAVKGFIVVRDSAWFLHPIMCFIFMLSYSSHFLIKLFKKYFRRSSF